MRRMMALLMLAALPAAAQAQSSPKDAADRFQLDLPGDDTVTTAEPAPTPAAAPATRYSLDTPIAELLANFRSKAVLDRDMPGLSTDKNLDKFEGKSLNQLAPLSGGRLSPELLEKVGKHLAAIG
jgi:hypothetical protein